MVNVLWNRSKEDYDLHTIALELLFEVCRSERLGEEDLGTLSLAHPLRHTGFLALSIEVVADCRMYIGGVY